MFVLAISGEVCPGRERGDNGFRPGREFLAGLRRMSSWTPPSTGVVRSQAQALRRSYSRTRSPRSSLNGIESSAMKVLTAASASRGSTASVSR